MAQAKVITFEGIDGSGKTSTISGVKETLEEKGKKVLVLREPGTTVMGESIRDLIKSDTVRHMSTDLMLFMAARNDMVKQVLSPAVGLYDYILIDRYTDSTLAYQGYGLGIDIDMIRTMQRYITKDVRIERTIFLDVSLEEASNRRNDRAETTDKYEDDEFLKRVYDGYMELIKLEPDRFLVVKNEDLDSTVKQVVNDILRVGKKQVTRRTVERHAGETMTMRAVVSRPGRTQEDQPTLMLKEVKKKGGRRIMADHLWVPYTRELVMAGTLVPGDMIEFTATATAYKKKYRGQEVDEYGLSDVKDVIVLKQVPIPKESQDELSRNDLSYIYSVTQEDLYNELLSRYVRFISAMVYKYFKGDV